MLLKNEDAKGKKDFIKVRGRIWLGGHSPFSSHFGPVISCKKKGGGGETYPCSNQNQTQEVLSNNAQHSINPMETFSFIYLSWKFKLILLEIFVVKEPLLSLSYGI